MKSSYDVLERNAPSFLEKCVQYSRGIYFLCAVICFSVLAFAIFYLQNTLWLEPCPYCKLQRVVFVLMGTLFMLLAIFNPKGMVSKISSVLVLGVGGLGIFVAGKHVYTQSHADLQTSSTCQSASDGILEVLDFEVVRNILSAKGDCGVVDWTFLGLSIPMLSLITYAVLMLVGLYVSVKK